jgi:hypothetical protein
MKRLIYVLLAFALCGCATAPLTLNPETAEKMKKIAIVSTQEDDEFKILYHLYGTNVAETTGSYLVGSMLDYAIQADETKKSLGGDPKVLKDKVKFFPIKKHINVSLAEQMSKRYSIVDSNYFEKLQEKSTDKNINIDEYIAHCKEIGADTLLTLDFLYGLAVYSRDMASADIDSIISVYDVKTNKALLEKVITSDLYFKEGYSIDEYAAEDGKLFKENIIKAARGLSLLIGYEFGIDVEYVDKTKRVLPVDAVHVSCKKPYLLEQDCSALKHAKRKIVINDFGCNVAASRDGTVILIKTTAKIDEATEEEIRAQDSYLTEKANNRCLELISGELSKNNVNILKKAEIIYYQPSFSRDFWLFSRSRW